MDIHILYSRPTCVTGRRIRDALGIRGSIDPPTRRVDYLIRWGSSRRVKYKPAEGVYNLRKAVAAASDKIESLRTMKDNHVPVPQFFVGSEVLNAPVGAFPMLAREKKHTQGTDIELCLQMTDVRRYLPGSDYFVSYIPTAREFRVHVFHDEVIKMNEKILEEPEDYVPHIRNYENGYIFKVVRDISKGLKNSIKDASVRATSGLHLDFGAVDLIVGDDGRVYVLEVNTGPSLSDNSLEVYIDKFSELLDLEPNWPAMKDADEEQVAELVGN